MARLNSDPFSILQTRVRAWEACARIPGCDKAIWRQDADGRVIRWADLGDRFSRYGWAILRERGESRLAQTLGLSSAKPYHVSHAELFEASPLRKAA